MIVYKLKLRESLNESVIQMWREKSLGGGGPCSVLEFLSDFVETAIVEFRVEQQKQKPNKAAQVTFRTGEDFRPMERKVLSAENVQRALYLLDSGVTPRSVAERFGVSAPTIYRIQLQRAATEHVRVRGKKLGTLAAMQRKAAEHEA